jgi:hypothetical protein
MSFRPIVVAAALLLGAGCSSNQGPRAVMDDSSGLPLWVGHAQKVFSDDIDPSALGLLLEGRASPRSDPFLRERAQTAEIVARVKVQTVTADSVGDSTTFHIGLLVGVPQLAKPRLDDLQIEVLIRASSPSYSVAKQFDASLQGRTFIGFFHRFASGEGEHLLHFYLAPDTPEVAAAVKEAVALGEFTGS